MQSSSTGSGGTAAGAGSAADATEQMRQATAEVQQTAGQALDQAKQQLGEQAQTRKGQVAESVGTLASALRQSGDQLRKQQDRTPVAQVLDSAAGRLDKFSGYLRQTDVQEIVGDVEKFARSQPAAFIGGAFTLGVLAARFLKTSGKADSSGRQTTALARPLDGADYPGSTQPPFRQAMYGSAFYDSDATYAGEPTTPSDASMPPGYAYAGGAPVVGAAQGSPSVGTGVRPTVPPKAPFGDAETGAPQPPSPYTGQTTTAPFPASASSGFGSSVPASSPYAGRGAPVPPADGEEATVDEQGNSAGSTMSGGWGYAPRVRRDMEGTGQ